MMMHGLANFKFKILLLDCGKRLHGIAETSKKEMELLFVMKRWTLLGI